MSKSEIATLTIGIISLVISIASLIWEKRDASKIQNRHNALDKKTQEYQDKITTKLSDLEKFGPKDKNLRRIAEALECSNQMSQNANFMLDESQKTLESENVGKVLDSIPLEESNNIDHH